MYENDKLIPYLKISSNSSLDGILISMKVVLSFLFSFYFFHSSQGSWDVAWVELVPSYIGAGTPPWVKAVDRQLGEY